MPRPSSRHIAAQIDAVARRERAAVLATVARDCHDLQVAEDAVQDALVAALRQWPRDGVPGRPGAWLTVAARRAAFKALSARARTGPAATDDAALAALAAPAPEPDRLPDARLELLFACCHPALGLESQVALTLRTAGGLTTPEIARLFLIEEAALAQRLVRAQRKLRDSGIPFSVPPSDRLDERLGAVLAVIYLIFTEGHAATSGAERMRGRLCETAVHLARLVAVLVPDRAEALGLAALCLATDARRDARVDPATGRTLSLEEQDRGRYDAAQLTEARGLLDRAMALAAPGPYQLQAAIAVLHTGAASAAATDWPQIAALYARLETLQPTPVVALNRAAAIGMTDGPDAGLARLDALVGELGHHHLWHAARAELLRRGGYTGAADSAYAAAIAAAPEAGTARADLARRRASLG